MRPLLLIVVMLTLAACQTCPPVPPPQVVNVRVTVPVPEALSAPCPVASAADRRVESVVAAHNANVESLEACNRRLAEIRALPSSDAAVTP